MSGKVEPKIPGMAAASFGAQAGDVASRSILTSCLVENSWIILFWQWWRCHGNRQGIPREGYISAGFIFLVLYHHLFNCIMALAVANRSRNKVAYINLARQDLKILKAISNESQKNCLNKVCVFAAEFSSSNGSMVVADEEGILHERWHVSALLKLFEASRWWTSSDSFPRACHRVILRMGCSV